MNTFFNTLLHSTVLFILIFALSILIIFGWRDPMLTEFALFVYEAVKIILTEGITL